MASQRRPMQARRRSVSAWRGGRLQPTQAPASPRAATVHPHQRASSVEVRGTGKGRCTVEEVAEHFDVCTDTGTESCSDQGPSNFASEVSSCGQCRNVPGTSENSRSEVSGDGRRCGELSALENSAVEVCGNRQLFGDHCPLGSASFPNGRAKKKKHPRRRGFKHVH